MMSRGGHGDGVQRRHQNWKSHMGNQAFRRMLKAMGPEINQAVSKHQAKRRHSSTSVLFAIYADKCQRDELTSPNEVS